MEEIIISRASREYWRKISRCAENLSRQIADDCWDKLYEEYGITLVENVSEYYLSLRDDKFNEYIKEDILNYIDNLSFKDKLLLRVAQYQMGDELSSKSENDRIIEFVISCFSSHVNNMQSTIK